MPTSLVVLESRFEPAASFRTLRNEKLPPRARPPYPPVARSPARCYRVGRSSLLSREYAACYADLADGVPQACRLGMGDDDERRCSLAHALQRNLHRFGIKRGKA